MQTNIEITTLKEDKKIKNIRSFERDPPKTLTGSEEKEKSSAKKENSYLPKPSYHND